MATTASSLTLPEGVMHNLEIVVCEQLAAVVEPNLSLEQLQDNDAVLLQAVLAHDRVIRELFAQTTVLPLRFSTFLALDALQLDLQTRQQEYLQTLKQLDGQAEYLVKLTPLEIEIPPIEATVKGKEYFLAKKQQHLELQQQRDQQITEREAIVQALQNHYRTTVHSDHQQIYVLVKRNNQPDLQKYLTELKLHSPKWNIHLGEMLPPFHFV